MINIEAAIDRHYAYDPRSPDYSPTKRCGNCTHIARNYPYDYFCTHDGHMSFRDIDDPSVDGCDWFEKQGPES